MKLLLVSGAYAAVHHANLEKVEWADVSTYDSYKWNPGATAADCAEFNGDCTGSLRNVPLGAPCGDSLLTKADLLAAGVTNNEAEFLQPSDPVWIADFMYEFDAGFIEGGFNRWTPLGHGTYCPTVDKNFWFNVNGSTTGSFIWFNWANNHWTMGKPSVEWWFEVDASAVRIPEPPCPPVGDVPFCQEGEVPMADENGCDDCRDDGRTGGCTLEMIENCNMTSIPTCKEGFRPVRDYVSCCETCKLPPKCPSREVPALCDLAAPVCATAEETALSWDNFNCCLRCTRPPADPVPTAAPTAGAPAPTSTPCTPTDIETCIFNTPVCIDDSEPQQLEGHCCANCKRGARQWSCGPVEVVNCFNESPFCGVGEEPVPLTGQCCNSCKMQPDCSPACGSGEACVYQGNLYSGSCVAVEDLELKLNEVSDTTRRVVDSMSNEELTALISEVLARYCDHGDVDCSDSTSVFVTSASTTPGQVTLTVSAPAATSGLLQKAAVDQDSVGRLQGEWTAATSSVAPVVASAAVVLFAATL